MSAIVYLFQLASTIIVGIFLLRFFMQLTRASFRNQFAAAIVQVTNPIVMPLRKIIPGWGGVDVASLLAAYLAQVGMIMLSGVAFSGGLPGARTLLVGSLIALLLAAISLYTVLLFLHFILSWINQDPGNPIVSMVYGLTEPLLRPIRRIIPPFGGLDLSIIAAFIVLTIARLLVENEISGLLL